MTLLTTILTPAPISAQTSTAAVKGLVCDSATRPLGDVEVVAVDLATGLEYRTLTSSTGRYWLGGLRPGSYEIWARRIGLRTTVVRNVGLAIGSTEGIDLTLIPAAVGMDPLVVEVDAARIERNRSGIAHVLRREHLEGIPQESRSFMELARLVPGATRGTESTGAFPGFGTVGSSVGALNRQSLGVLLDGGDFTEGLFGDPSGSVPLLAIREFEVIQGQYSADYGKAASGVVNGVTRRGGNDLRVEGFGLYRHRALNARGAFEREKPDFSRYHWGAAVGGPLTPNRTHFFAAFERRSQDEFSTVNTGGAFPGYEGTFKTPLRNNLFFARLDHRASDSHEVMFRYSGEMGSQLGDVGGINALEYGHKKSRDMHSGLLLHRWALAGSWLNEARFHVLSTRSSLLRNAPPGPTLFYHGSLRAGPNEGEDRNRSVRIELRDDLSWVTMNVSGTHRLKVGSHLSWLLRKVASSFFESGALFFRTSTDSLPYRAQISFRDPALHLDDRNFQFSIFIQDDWNPSPEIVVNLGLRYDLETNGSNQGFVSPFAGDLPFVPARPRPSDMDNFGPRVGVSWDPTGEGRLVLRGGLGVFYDALVGGPTVALERSSGVPLAVVFQPGTRKIGELEIDPDSVPPVVWTAGEIETPMTRQYSLGVEGILPGDVFVRVDALLVQGRHLLLQRNLNPVEDGTFRYPEFSTVTQLLSEGRAEAKMLLVNVRKRFSRGWLNVGYTLANRRNTNDTWSADVPQTDPDYLDLDGEWGPSAWDERHRVVAGGGIEVPGDMIMGAKLIYASARPFTALIPGDPNGDLDPLNDRPPGEGRNARRGPDFFRADVGLTWWGMAWGSKRLGLTVNVFNLFNTTNGVPSSVQNVLGQPGFGRPLAAYPMLQGEVGVRVMSTGGSDG